MTPKIHTMPARPGALETARRVVAEPHAGDSPALRLLAWATLKSRRGQPILQTAFRRGGRA